MEMTHVLDIDFDNSMVRGNLLADVEAMNLNAEGCWPVVDESDMTVWGFVEGDSEWFYGINESNPCRWKIADGGEYAVPVFHN